MLELILLTSNINVIDLYTKVRELSRCYRNMVVFLINAFGINNIYGWPKRDHVQ